MNVDLKHTLGPQSYIPAGKALESFHDEVIADVSAKMEQIAEQQKGVPPVFGDDKLPVEKREGDAIALAEPMAVYINHGRLLVDCAVCNAGVHVDVVDEVAPCFQCGTTWRTQHLAFPADLVAIDAVLGARRTDKRNFDPRRGETLQTLTAEKNVKVERDPGPPPPVGPGDPPPKIGAGAVDAEVLP